MLCWVCDFSLFSFHGAERNTKTKRKWGKQSRRDEKNVMFVARSHKITSWFRLCRFMTASCCISSPNTHTHTFAYADPSCVWMPSLFIIIYTIITIITIKIIIFRFRNFTTFIERSKIQFLHAKNEAKIRVSISTLTRYTQCDSTNGSVGCGAVQPQQRMQHFIYRNYNYFASNWCRAVWHFWFS